MKNVFFKRGQNLTEVALIIGIVGLVLIGMEVYTRRGIQAKVKDLTDNMIGKEQEAYQQDTSGLAVNTSTSTLTLLPKENVRTVEERLGGQKIFTANETSVTDYSSCSSDNLKNCPGPDESATQ